MTPNDLQQIGKLLDNKLEKKLKEHEKRIVNKTVKLVKEAIEESEAHIISVVDKTKADKVDLRDLETRVDKIEHAVFP